MTRRHFGAAAWSAALLWLAVAGCGDEARQRFQIVDLPTGVDRVEVKVVGATSDCSVAAVAVVTVAVSHGVAVVTVNLAPGDYRLCVTPVDVTGAPATDCPSFSDTFTARSGGGEFVLWGVCDPAQAGGDSSSAGLEPRSDS